MDKNLHAGIEDIVYTWSLESQSWARLVDELHDYVISTYGPPF